MTTDLDHFKAATTFAGYEWQYDVGSRVTSFTNSQHTAEDATYNYDDTNQLTGADRTGTTNDETYTYDDSGNRTMTGYSTGEYNRISSDGTYNYTYDDEGNITLRTRISDDYYTEYEWDHSNRLVSVTDYDDQDAQLQQVSYEYDFANRLVSRTIQIGQDPAETGYFIYDGTNMTLSLDENAAVQQRLLWSARIDEALANENASDETYWFLTDNQGTIRDFVEYDATLDQTTIANHIDYNSYGERTSETDDTLDVLDLGYTGRYFDRDTELQWNNARWYNASIGRWMSRDWIYDNPDGMGVYVGNSPTTATDPTGLEDVKDREDVKVPAWARNFPLLPGMTIGGLVDRHNRNMHFVDTAEQAAKQDPNSSVIDGVYMGAGTMIADQCGISEISDAAEGNDLVSDESLSMWERIKRGTIGSVTLIGTAVGLKASATGGGGGSARGGSSSGGGGGGGGGAPTVVSRIKESPKLVRNAESTGKSLQEGLDRLTKQLCEGNRNPGIGTKPIGKGISEARARGGARVYFRELVDGTIEILGKSDKSNQGTVIAEILERFGG